MELRTSTWSLLSAGLVAAIILPCAWAIAQGAGKAPASAPAPEVKSTPVRPGVVAYVNLDYAGKGEGRQMLDLYIPTNAKGPTPVIVWFHGGGWRGGDKGAPLDEARYTGQGYAVASANYRYSTQAVYPAQIEDCKAVIRFLRGNAKKYNLDGAHVGAWGASAGGHLVALLAVTGGAKELEGKVGSHLNQSSRLQAVVDLCGPTDWLLPNQPGVLVDVMSGLVGGPIEKNKELARKASPVTFASKDATPILIAHGQADDTVPIKHAEELYDLLKKAGADATYMPLKDTGHGGGGFDTPESRKAFSDFFDKHLKPSAASRPAAM
jgi:acetyl esterase/lipase